jgi:hypothetical protein
LDPGKDVGKAAPLPICEIPGCRSAGCREIGQFQTGLFDAGNGTKEIVYVIEDLGDGTLIALFPYAPTGFAGPVKVVPKRRIEALDTSLGDMSLVLNHMGLGAGRLLRSKTTEGNR